MRRTDALALGAALLFAAGCASTERDRPSLAVAAPDPATPKALPPASEITDVPLHRESWSFGGYEGEILVTPHYRVHTTLTRAWVRDRLPLFVERALVHYTTAIARLPHPTAPLETYLFESRHEWEAKTRLMLDEDAPKYLRLGRGGFTTRGISVLYYIGRRDTLAIAAHEGWHQFSQQTLGPLPIWLEEGIATYMEGYVSHPDGVPKFRPWANLERYHALRQAARSGRLIPLDELTRRRPEALLERGGNSLLLYYAQVWALVHFIMEGDGSRYRAGLQQLLVEAADRRARGRSSGSGSRLGPSVVSRYFDRDIDAFERRYLRFVHEITQTGGRDRIVRGQSPLHD